MWTRRTVPGLAAALILLAPATEAEEPSEGGAAFPERKFEHLGPEHGLSSPTVYALTQDRTGFLWLGTEGGLNRYDGYAFEVYRHDPNDAGSLASDDISSVLEDRDGILWLATWGGGLDRFDPLTETFQHFRAGPAGRGRPGSGLADDRVQHVLEDAAGTLWVGTYSGGLSRFDRAAGTFETFRHDPGDPASLCHDRVWRILEEPVGILWLATGSGLCRFDPAAGTFERLRHRPDDPTSLSDDLVRTLYFDSNGVLWVGTGSGLNRLVDREDGTFERILAGPGGLSNDVVTALFEDSRGTLWVGTRGGGLNLLEPATGRWRHLRHDPSDPSSLSDDDVRAIFEDRAGVLWIATRQGGLNKLDLKPPKFELVESRPGDPDGIGNGRIRAFAEDSRGRLWLATGEGVARRDADRPRFDHFRHDPADPASLASNDVHALLIDRHDELWVAAGRTGLHRRVPGGTGFRTFRHDPADPGSLADDLVSALYEDRSGDLWIGTVSGLDRMARPAIDRGRPDFEHFRHRPGDSESLSEDFVTVLLEGSGGRLWVGTHNGGLNRRDGGSGRFERFVHDPREASSLSNDRVFALYRQPEGTLWVGTANGLNELRDDGTFRRYLEKDGLASPQVAGILGDGEGRLWVATGHGLSRLDPRTGVFRNYTARDGLQAGPFNSGSALKRRDGSLCFGGNSGYNCFDPLRVVDNPHRTPVVLTGFEKLGEAVDFHRAPWAVDAVRLSHRDTYFSFRFAALDFTRPQDNRYRYLLEGFDRGWIDAGPHRSASYTRVPPGSYVFRVRAANSDAVWSDRELAVAVSIQPPFWGTAWFRALAALTLVLGAGAGYRFRIRALKRREQLLSRRVEEGLADLRRSEERYRLLFERNLAGVVRATTSGEILDCNEAFARILGYASARECRQQHFLESESSPGGEPSLLARLRETGTVVGYETTARRRDGSTVSLLWNASLVGEGDEPAVALGTVIDVSERRRIEEGLRRAQKLESLGVLAGGVAHDFNNLLMSILGNAELSRMGLDPSSAIYRRLEQIEVAGERAAELSKQMLAYSGKGELVVSRLDLSEEVGARAHLLAGAVSKKAQIVYRLETDLPAIEADAGQIEQIVISLVTNASEALGGDAGTITVRTGSREFRSEDLASTYLDDRLPAGRYVFLEVADDGCGMDDDLQLKIFDPFFTTKFTGRGLGLAAVLGIVRGHRGAIRIDSAPGSGSTFTVLFPAAPEEALERRPGVPAGAGARGQGTILVVDDDEFVRRVAGDMLEKLGFEVLTARDGQEGLEVFRGRSGDVALVILDLSMPRMSGQEAFREIRRVAPEARVLLASGYDERANARLFAGREGPAGFIQKPYRFDVLRDKIREVLG